MSILEQWLAGVGRAVPLRALAHGVPLLLLCACPDPGSLTVAVLDDPATNIPVLNAMVSVQGTALSAVTNSSGVAYFGAIPAGTHTLITRLAGICQASHTVTVPPGPGTLVALYLCQATPVTPPAVTPPPLPPEPQPEPEPEPDTDPVPAGADQITVTNPAGATPLLLFDAAIDGATCVSDRTVTTASPLVLGVNAVAPGTGGCHTSVALFTPNHGFYYSSDATAIPWTAGADDLPVTLPPLLRVPVTVWVGGSLTGAARTVLIEKIRTVHLDGAGDILREAGSGLELVADPASGGEPEIIDVLTLPNGPDLLNSIGSGCSQVASIRAQPKIYRATHLNLYYVGAITEGNDASGYNCGLEDAPEIMFLDDDLGFPHTVAHEIGHALGLVEPFWGHTHDYLAGFITGPSYPKNFMAYGAKAEGGSLIYASRGQALRMNLSTLSWLNRPGPDGTTPRKTNSGTTTPFVTTCPCPADEASDDCPVLPFTDLTGDGLTAGVTWELACGVTLESSEITVCKDKTLTLKATFHAMKYGVKQPARLPEKALWQSANPGRAVATESGSAEGVSTGSITGVSLGTTEVKVYAGGITSMAKLGVTVTACP